MMASKLLLAAGAAALLAMPGLAVAQPQRGVTVPAQAQPAAGCLDDLQALRQQMRQDGLWLSGYRRGYGWPASSAAARSDPTAARTAPGVGNIDALSGPSARARAAEVQAQGGGAIRSVPTPAAGVPAPGATAAGATEADGPWGATGWRMPPIQELRVLHAAAAVLAQRGEEQGCRTVLAELRETYGGYAEQFRRTGNDARGILAYREQRIAAARPVAEIGGVMRADNLTGAEVRSPRNDDLGSIEDLVFDPETGRVAYVILAHDGFLGIGEEYVVVPWQRLRTTPQMDVFVLDATEAMLDGAPAADPASFADRQRYDRARQEIDAYWQRQQ